MVRGTVSTGRKQAQTAFHFCVNRRGILFVAAASCAAGHGNVGRLLLAELVRLGNLHQLSVSGNVAPILQWAA